VIILGLSFLGLFEGLARLITGAAACPTSTINNVEMVTLLAHKGLVVWLSLSVAQSDAMAQTHAAIGSNLFDMRQTMELLSPSSPFAVRGQTSSQPAQALLFNHHEDGVVPAEDLIGSHLSSTRTTVSIQDFQELASLLSSDVGASAQFCPAGSIRTKKDAQKGMKGSKADAEGLAGSSELVLLIPIDLDGVG
jgi:hypothetical protein